LPVTVFVLSVKTAADFPLGVIQIHRCDRGIANSSATYLVLLEQFSASSTWHSSILPSLHIAAQYQ
jgi:hypothetical protein